MARLGTLKITWGSDDQSSFCKLPSRPSLTSLATSVFVRCRTSFSSTARLQYSRPRRPALRLLPFSLDIPARPYSNPRRQHPVGFIYMRKNRFDFIFRCLLALVFTVTLAGHASAQRYWSGAGLNPATAGAGTWDNANMQWSSTFPTYTAATWDSNIANFNGTVGGTVTIGETISVADINFGAHAGAFTLLNSGLAQTFFVNGTGITNNSANTQAIINSGLASQTAFLGIATAANATITNSGTGSETAFSNSATAANATITNSGSNSLTAFFTTATSDNAAITNSGSGSLTFFETSASGGNASLINANPGAIIDISQLT